MVFGTFDLVHPGHVYFLEQAKKLGDFLTVVIARDETVLKVKGRLPVNTALDRQKTIERLHVADKVVLGNLEDKFKVVRDENPSVIALGYDQKSIVENLEEKVGKTIQVLRLAALRPEYYKSSKLKKSPSPITDRED